MLGSSESMLDFWWQKSSMDSFHTALGFEHHQWKERQWRTAAIVIRWKGIMRRNLQIIIQNPHCFFRLEQWCPITLLTMIPGSLDDRKNQCSKVFQKSLFVLFCFKEIYFEMLFWDYVLAAFQINVLSFMKDY